MPVEVFDREREAVVNTHDGWCVRRKFLGEPLGKTPPRPVPPWTWGRLNLYRLAGALGDEHTQPFTTGVGGFSAGVVDADVATECCFQVRPPALKAVFRSFNCGFLDLRI